MTRPPPPFGPARSIAVHAAAISGRVATAQAQGVSGAGAVGAAAIAAGSAVTSLLLQTIVVPGRDTGEGSIIEAVALPWVEIAKHLADNWALAFQIPARQWEEIIAGAYKQAGFEEVILTPRSGDGGRDVIAIKKAIGTIRVIDQVKAYSPGHLVTADDVRALYGVLVLDRSAKGFVTTTSDFAPRLKDDGLLASVMPSQIELVNGDALRKRLDELTKDSKPKP